MSAAAASREVSCVADVCVAPVAPPPPSPPIVCDGFAAGVVWDVDAVGFAIGALGLALPVLSLPEGLGCYCCRLAWDILSRCLEKYRKS